VTQPAAPPGARTIEQLLAEVPTRIGRVHPAEVPATPDERAA
jgi:hypothetical protein